MLRNLSHEDVRPLAPVPFEVFGEERVRFLHGVYADAAGRFPSHPQVDRAIDKVQMDYWEQSSKPTSKTKETMEEQVRLVRGHVLGGGVAVMPSLSGNFGYTVGHAQKGFPELRIGTRRLQRTASQTLCRLPGGAIKQRQVLSAPGN